MAKVQKPAGHSETFVSQGGWQRVHADYYYYSMQLPSDSPRAREISALMRREADKLPRKLFRYVEIEDERPHWDPKVTGLRIAVRIDKLEDHDRRAAHDFIVRVSELLECKYGSDRGFIRGARLYLEDGGGLLRS